MHASSAHFLFLEGVNLFSEGDNLILVLSVGQRQPEHQHRSILVWMVSSVISLVILAISAAPFVYPHTWSAKVRATRHNCKLSD